MAAGKTLDRRGSLGRIQAVVERALPDFGKAGRLTWVRDTPELQHVIAFLDRRGGYHVQWGIVSPETTPIMWGEEGKSGDVGSAVLSGTPSSIRQPAPGASFRFETANDPAVVDAIAAAVEEELRLTANWMRDLQTRRELRDYLLANRDKKDPRGFVIPTNLPLKLFTAAALAAVDRDPLALELLPDVEAHLSSFGGPMTSRLVRLRSAMADISG
jgi:hypothetical protein